MGIPIHRRRESDPGVPCDECELSTWGPDRTPKFCRAVFHGIIPTGPNPPPPNDFPFTLEQVPAAPCNYEAWPTFGGYDWHIRFWSTISLLELAQTNSGEHGYFWGYYSPCLAGPFPNDFPVGQNYAGGGSGYILDLPVNYVLLLALDYNLQPMPDALYDDQPASDPDQRCIRLTSRSSPGSVLVLFSPPS